MSTVQQAAAAIVQLINASPRSPRIEEVEAVITRAMQEERMGGHPPGKPITCAADVEFEPAVNPETGQPLEFEYTIEEFANTYHPWIVMAFSVIGKDREQLREVVRGLTNDPEDPGAEALFEMIDAFDSIHKKFEAIAHFAQAAMARVMMIADLEGRS